MQQAVEIPVLKHQIEFIRSNATHTGLVAGFGSGKSIAGTLKTIEKKKMYPGINVAYYLPTYGLIKDIAYPNFRQQLDVHEIPYQLNKSDKVFETPLGNIILRSMDNPDTIVGYEVGYSCIDEADIMEKKKMELAFVKIAGRNRVPLPDGLVNSIDLVSTPEGFNFMYDFFVRNKKPNRELIKAKTTDNPFLPETYIQTLLEIYTNEQLEAYLNGEFVNLTSGTVHRTFDRTENHSDREIKPHDKLHIGMDFNIGNMHAIIHVVDGKTPIAVDEIAGAFDTPEMISKIQNRFKGHTIVIYPDASGANRKTSSADTDIKLLKQARFVVKNLTSNPAVRDRVNTMNSAFLNAKGERGYLVNTNNCPIYTEALEKQAYKNGEPDKTTGFDHPNEAGGYFIWQFSKSKSIRINV
ncbi:terminase large subunit domain-containing protein [Xanthomarina gelatinilytica]|uniref:phage terminase large subunit family protein n=1 Tax=Xanthomarina gelatinilytica TaxID=1137281 RepID=UPI003AA9D54A